MLHAQLRAEAQLRIGDSRRRLHKSLESHSPFALHGFSNVSLKLNAACVSKCIIYNASVRRHLCVLTESGSLEAITSAADGGTETAKREHWGRSLDANFTIAVTGTVVVALEASKPQMPQLKELDAACARA